MEQVGSCHSLNLCPFQRTPLPRALLSRSPQEQVWRIHCTEDVRYEQQSQVAGNFNTKVSAKIRRLCQWQVFYCKPWSLYWYGWIGLTSPDEAEVDIKYITLSAGMQEYRQDKSLGCLMDSGCVPISGINYCCKLFYPILDKPHSFRITQTCLTFHVLISLCEGKSLAYLRSALATGTQAPFPGRKENTEDRIQSLGICLCPRSKTRKNPST